MNTRRMMIILTTVVLIGATLLAVSTQSRVTASSDSIAAANKVVLENVRDYAAAPAYDADADAAAAAASGSVGAAWAVDGGLLYTGQPLDWNRVLTPEGVIVSAVALDSSNPQAVYIGAANQLAIYRSLDSGANWMYVPLTDPDAAEIVGGVTDLVLDSETRLLYVGTDTSGLYRLRDVGTSITAGGHYAVDKPIVEVAADSTGAGMAFFRTDDRLYRSENGGLVWSAVDSLSSTPTTLQVANSKPPVVYVGTVDRGVLRSDNGIAWMSANDGLNLTPGNRLRVDALAVDPQQPDVVYVATSFLFGNTEIHETPAGVHMTTSAAGEWAPIVRSSDVPAAGLLPVSGKTGAVYSVSNRSRSPLALGVAPIAPRVVAMQPAPGPYDWAGSAAAWSAAILAALWLAVLVTAEMRKVGATQASPLRQTVRIGR